MRKMRVDTGDGGKKEVLLQLVKEPMTEVHQTYAQPMDFKKPTDFASASMVLPNE